MDIYKPNEFAALVGVSVKTLQRWDNDGKLKAWQNDYLYESFNGKSKK